MDESDSLLAGLIIFTLGLFGLLVNAFSLLLLCRVRIYRGSFAVLCASHAAGNFGILLSMTLWAAPLAWSNGNLASEAMGQRVGPIILFFWYSSLYSQLCIAFNRFFAITRPYFYYTRFTNRNTCKLVLVTWSLATIHMIPYAFEGCSFIFCAEDFRWHYSETSCGSAISVFLDFYHAFAVVVCVLLLDSITFVRCILLRKGATTTSQEISDRRGRKEMLFFAQSCTSALNLVALLLIFNVFVYYASEGWGTFFLSTVSWEAMHVVDGIIVVVFNPSYRKLVLRPSALFNNTEIEKIQISEVKLFKTTGKTTK